jgi:hypothetical protein
MAIAYRTIVTEDTPSTVLALDPGASAGDVIYSGAVNDSMSAITFTHPASFDELAEQANTYDAHTAVVARKKNASGSEGTLNTTDDLSSSKVGFMISFSGVDNTTPEDIAVDVVNNNTGTASPWTIDSSAITPATSGAKILAIMFSDTNSITASHAFSTVGGSTSAWTVHDASIGGGTRNIGVASADWVSGAVTVRGTGSGGGATAGRSMVTIVLRPAGGGTTIVSRESTRRGAGRGVLRGV